MARSTRRDVILDCVIDLLASRGIQGVTHRAVDEVARLPPGSTSYYFSKKTALLIAASDHLANLLGKDCDEVQMGFAQRAARDGIEEAIGYVGSELVKYADVARHLFLARIELTMASSRDPDLSGVGARLTLAARRPIEFFLTLISGGRPDVPIETCAGLIDGITLMHVTGQGRMPTLAQITAVFAAVR